jgi:hypothetical protein
MAANILNEFEKVNVANHRKHVVNHRNERLQKDIPFLEHPSITFVAKVFSS